jgi:hypothetical protein
MKTNELGKTVLILFGTMLAAFTLCTCWMSRQSAALREVQTACASAKEELGHLQVKRNRTEGEIAVLQANVAVLKRCMANPTAQAYLPILTLRTKRAFNDIEHHVAKGEFAELALTDGYMELREIFDNPAFEEKFEGYHATAP